MSDDIHELISSDQHVPAGNPLLSFRVAPELEAAIRACAAALGMTHTEWARTVLGAEQFPAGQPPRALAAVPRRSPSHPVDPL
jgi:hypothetical protein